jgi:pyruvate dehydrogenase E2 component (dihydrolipoamide acetyltransferase)
MFGVKEFTAIINPPQMAILAVGAPQRVMSEGARDVRTVVSVTLSVDAGRVEPPEAAAWLDAFAAALADPMLH